MGDVVENMHFEADGGVLAVCPDYLFSDFVSKFLK